MKQGHGERSSVGPLVIDTSKKSDTNAYAVIQAFKDRLEIDGFGREPNHTIKVNTIQERDGDYQNDENQENNHEQNNRDQG